MKKFLMALALLLACICLGNSSVWASPAVQYSNNGLAIAYPKHEFYPQYQNITLFFSVYNSTGHQLPWGADIPACTFTLYSNTGAPLFYKNLTYNSTYTSWNFSFFVPDTNDTGRYPYTLYCYNTKEQGFVSSYFEITGEGKSSDPLSRISIEMFGVAIFIFLFSVCLGMFIYMGYPPFKIMCGVLAAFFLVYAINLIAIMMENETGNPNILAIYQRFGTIGYTLLYFVFGVAFIYFFVWAVTLVSQRKEEMSLKRAGMDDTWGS